MKTSRCFWLVCNNLLCMKKLFYFFLFCSLSIITPLSAQHDLAPCGSNDYYSPWLRNYLKNGGANQARTNEVIYVPVQIHVVGTDEGSGYMKYKTVMESFCKLNADFEDTNIKFFLYDELNYIDNSNYYQHDFNGGYSMMVNNNVSGAVNCYIVDDPASNCGYFSPGADGVALAKGCTQPSDNTWAHEMGHFLSLPHTFWGWEWAESEDMEFSTAAPTHINDVEVEKADGSNCADAADGFCDTPADYINYRWTCNGSGESFVQLDPDGTPFTSDGSFFMSYSNDACAARFSEEQMGAMRANIEQQRPYLLSTPPNEEDVVMDEQTTIVPIYPLDDATIEGDAQSVRIEWEPVPNATKYLVQLNPFPFFSVVFNEFLVDEPFVDFDDLLPNETFYWRVIPFNDYSTCTSFSSTKSFTTTTVVSTNELLAGEDFRVYPNPVSNGQVWMEFTSLNNVDAHWSLSDMNGRVLKQAKETLAVGQQTIALPTNALNSGMYMLKVQMNDRVAVRKFVVQ